MPKFPTLSRPKLLKVQVTQSSSHPNLKLPKVQVAQIAKSPSCPYIEKYVWLSQGQKYLWPQMAKNVLIPPMAKNTFNSHYSQDEKG